MQAHSHITALYRDKFHSAAQVRPDLIQRTLDIGGEQFPTLGHGTLGHWGRLGYDGRLGHAANRTARQELLVPVEPATGLPPEISGRDHPVE